MLDAPFFSSDRKVAARLSGEIGRPAASLRLMARFWQNTQPSEQCEKNTVPEPFSPEMTGSSHK